MRRLSATAAASLAGALALAAPVGAGTVREAYFSDGERLVKTPTWAYAHFPGVSLTLSRLRWKAWGTARAVGTGVGKSCPNMSECSTERASFVLDRLTRHRCRGGDRYIYRRARVFFAGGGRQPFPAPMPAHCRS